MRWAQSASTLRERKLVTYAPTPSPAQDLAVFPGDAELLPVDTGREGDRVYRLEFAGRRRLFFWMQEPKAAGDAAAVKKVNELIQNPPSRERGGGAAGGAGRDLLAQLGLGRGGGQGGGNPGASAAALEQLLRGGGGDLAALLGGGGGGGGGGGEGQAPPPDMGGYGGMSEEEQLARAIAESMEAAAAPSPPAETPSGTGGDEGATSPHSEAPATPTSTGAAEQGGEAAFTAEMMEGLVAGAMAALAQQQGGGGVLPVSLTALVTPEAVEGVMQDEDAVESLVQHLPESQRNAAGLRATLTSPQFQQTLRTLTGALQGENFNTVFASFDLAAEDGADALAAGDAVGAFVAALQASVGQADQGGAGGAEEGSESPEDGEHKEGGEGDPQSGGGEA